MFMNTKQFIEQNQKNAFWLFTSHKISRYEEEGMEFGLSTFWHVLKYWE